MSRIERMRRRRDLCLDCVVDVGLAVSEEDLRDAFVLLQPSHYLLPLSHVSQVHLVEDQEMRPQVDGVVEAFVATRERDVVTLSLHFYKLHNFHTYVTTYVSNLCNQWLDRQIQSGVS